MEAGDKHPSWNREQALEEIRKGHYACKPSRMKSCFAIDDINVAMFYQWRHAKTATLSLVQPVLEGVGWHRGDFNCLEPMPRCTKTMDEIAHIYWIGKRFVTVKDYEHLDCMELLAETPLRVLGRLCMNQPPKGGPR